MTAFDNFENIARLVIYVEVCGTETVELVGDGSLRKIYPKDDGGGEVFLSAEYLIALFKLVTTSVDSKCQFNLSSLEEQGSPLINPDIMFDTTKNGVNSMYPIKIKTSAGMSPVSFNLTYGVNDGSKTKGIYEFLIGVCGLEVLQC